MLCAVLVGCATQHKPEYQAVTEFYPDCANRDAQIRYLSKLQRFPVQDDTATDLYNQTLRIQIDRLIFYCK